MDRIIAGSPVTGTEFIGRENELRKISHLIEIGQHIVLIAPRRFGKTSLILELLRRTDNKDYYRTYVDIFSSPTLKYLSENITKAVLGNNKLDKVFTQSKKSAVQMFKNTKLKAVIENFEFLLEFAGQNKNQLELLTNSIDFIDGFAKKHKKHMICTFDEFGDIKKLNGENIVKLFRSKIQLHKHTSYIFAGSYESVMKSLFVKKNAPFFRFAQIIEPGYIDKKDFLAYYQGVFKKHGISTQGELISRILDFTKGHPYYSKLALQEILIFFLIQKKIPAYDNVIEMMLIAERSYLEKSWEEMLASRENMKTLLAIVNHRKNIYSVLKNEGLNIARAVASLKDKGIIFIYPDKTYALTDPLFEYWIQTNIL